LEKEAPPAIVRIGVIGCGQAAVGLHLPVLARIPGVQVTAIADADSGRLTHAGSRWSVDQRYSDYRALIADKSVDTVLISVPAYLHAQVFVEAANAGLNIYLEKPLALTLAEAEHIIGAARVCSGCCVMGFNLRSHRLVKNARDLIATGALGPIELIRTSFVGGVGEATGWRQRRAEGGGSIYEFGVHHFDLWRYLLNAEVLSVSAHGVSSRWDDATVGVTAEIENGALASSVFAFGGAETHEIEIIGRAGLVRFSLYHADSFEIRPRGRVSRAVATLTCFADAITAARHGGDYADSFRRHWVRFLRSARDGEPSPATVEDGCEALRIALSAIHSIEHPECGC
jgi:predicted dehydrogenase